MSAMGPYIYMHVEPEVVGYTPIHPGFSSQIRERPREDAPTPAPEPFPFARTPESFIDRELVQAARSLQHAEARVVAKEAALLVRLTETRGFERLGCSSLGDFAREILRIDPRTARNRVALARVLAERPDVRDAYLAGAVSACQVLALRSILNDANEAEWIERCASMTVRELIALVRAARVDPKAFITAAEEESADDPQMHAISFQVPASVRVAWDVTLETARMTLGWDAPVYRCVEAILAEAAPGSCPETPLPPEKPGRSRQPRAASVVFAKHDDRASTTEAGPDLMSVDPCRRALITLHDVSALLDEIHDLIDEAASDIAHELLDRIRALQILDRSMRVLLGRILRDLIDTRAVYRLGFFRVSDFLQERLYISERNARDLVRESDVFADCPAIEAAWSSGRIGIRQALVIHRLAPTAQIPEFISRAESVTLRQFVREMRVIEKLQDLGMHYFARPFPHTGLERAILRRLRKLGWTDEKLASALERLDVSRWLFQKPRRKGRVPQCADTGAVPVGQSEIDPARNPLAMRRIEVLVDLLLLSTFENAVERWDDLALVGADRQMFSAAAELADSGDSAGTCAAPDVAQATSADRQTFSVSAELAGAPSADRQAFSAPAAPPVSAAAAATDLAHAGNPRPMKRIRFTAPEPIARHWQGAICDIQRESGLQPVWTCVLKLLRDAMETWHAHDPEAIPTMKRILDRDGYLCQVPGCSNRRHLEVHHVDFRSRGGSNADDNLITLCHTHHQHAIHKGYVRVSGAAPHDLFWKLGARKNMPPVLTLRGECLSPRIDQA